MINNRKNKRSTKNSQKQLVSSLAIILSALAAIIAIIFIGDLLNLEEYLNTHLRFDWATILCSFLSATAAISLGVISMVQNKKLSDINEKSLETAKINENYSLIRFRKTQSIKDGGRQLKMKLYDTKNIPLNHISVKEIRITPLESAYKEAGVPSIKITKAPQTTVLNFTPINPSNSEDFYYADVKVAFPFEKYEVDNFIRLELEIEVNNVLGVTTHYTYYLLCKVSEKTNDKIELNNYYEFNYFRGVRLTRSKHYSAS